MDLEDYWAHETFNPEKKGVSGDTIWVDNSTTGDWLTLSQQSE